MQLFENEVINITKIYTVDRYETTKLSKYTTMKSHAYELLFSPSGVRFTYYGDKRIDDVPNSVRYLPRVLDGDEYVVEVVEPGECIDIFFDTCDILPDFAVGLKNMNELKPLFLKIYNVWNAKKTGFYTECMSILYEIIRKIQLHNEKYFTLRQAQKILPSYDYMLEHFSESDFNYKEMCARSQLSYDYFKELFIKRYSVSPVKYVTMLRVEKAKELLITGQYTIAQIAEQCGFENVYYFSTVFKKQTGVSPKNYKLK